MLSGDMERLRVIMDAAVRTPPARRARIRLGAGRQHSRGANFLANRTEWAGDAAGDADEALEIYRRLGDAWGNRRGALRPRRGP